MEDLQLKDNIWICYNLKLKKKSTCREKLIGAMVAKSFFYRSRERDKEHIQTEREHNKLSSFFRFK